MQIDIVSDVVCPWCFIGKRRLAQALAQRPDAGIEIFWRPYQLDPNVPREGLDRADYMRAKFGDVERVKGMSNAIREHGAELGIAFDFERQTRRPNTIDAHRLIRWAGGVGVQDAVVEALFRAYFEQGRDVGEHDVLIEVAAACGMDGDLVKDLLASDADETMVLREAAMATDMGVAGVPAFIVDSKYLLVGAQDSPVLLRAIDKAIADRGPQQAAE